MEISHTKRLPKHCSQEALLELNMKILENAVSALEKMERKL